MEQRRFNKRLENENLQKKLAENRRKGSRGQEQVPDIADFMNDMFFGAVNNEKKVVYNLTGEDDDNNDDDDDDDDFESSTRSTSSRLTQEWLEEAKKLVASSPNRTAGNSPSQLAGSPRFGVSGPRLTTTSSVSVIDRDPLSRSARRNRSVDGFTGEILTKSSHSRNNSQTTDQKWFNNILLKPPNGDDIIPPRASTHRRSRFENQSPPPALPSATIVPPRLSTHRRSRFQNVNPTPTILSPPRNLMESAQRRSISSSTCFTHKKIPTETPPPAAAAADLNGFLKDQRSKILKLIRGEIKAGKANIVLSGHSNSTSSMVSAICYAWLLDTKMRNGDNVEMVVPVLNVTRGKMWKQRQAAWLFHHAGVDAAAILFSDEIELEVLMMKKQLSIVVVGQEILKTNDEVGSWCTILTENYCEDAYDLLQNPVLKKLMLAGILLDTQNLNIATTKDTEAARLLAVGSEPNYGNSLYDQLTQEQIRDGAFFEALRKNYGKIPNDQSNLIESASPREANKALEEKHRSPKTFEMVSRKDPNQAEPDTFAPSATPKPPTKQSPSPAKSSGPAREKGKNPPFFLAKWFGFAKR